MSNFPPLRPPPRPRSPPGQQRSQDSVSQRSESSMSVASSDSSQLTSLSTTTTRRSPYPLQREPTSSAPGVRPSTAGGPTPSQSSASLQTLNRLPVRTSVDGVVRVPHPNMPPTHLGHRARQHSQGFFEPSLPSHATSNHTGLTASQIAAQAAMQQMSPPIRSASQERKRSYPGLAPINTANAAAMRRPSETSSPQFNSTAGLPYSNGIVGGHRLAATTAANVVFPNARSPLSSPGVPHPVPSSQILMPPPPLDKEPKSKSSKMKLFSKPKNLTLTKEKEVKVAPGAPSPGKSAIGGYVTRNGFGNASTASLVEPSSSASSIYSYANASTSTLVPTEKEKSRHNFLTRGKHKLKDEQAALPLSSANSNSQATNPDRPQPLYSFTPDSPATSSFSKTMSGFDLRHGGRALREKKKEEKAQAAAAKLDLMPTVSNTSLGDKSEFHGAGSYEGGSFGPPTGTGSVFSYQTEVSTPAVSAVAFSNIGASMGLPGIGPDDAWPLLKARLLNLFSGESLLRPVEELNVLVSVHIRRCIQRKSPILIVEDLRELLHTGFSSLAQTLRGVPDDRLVTKLVDLWSSVYGAILPFLQAVFLPLDLEFKGRGIYLSVREAQEFWGAMPESLKADERPGSASGPSKMPSLGEELDVRRITLIEFRDTVILPKHESLMAIFSRLSLESINASSPDPSGKGREHARSDPTTTGAERPGTAGSLSPHMSSFNSQGSILLDAASSSSGNGISLAGRSRATSNTSAGSFGTSLPHVNSPLPGSLPSTTIHPPPPASPAFTDPAKVTDTVARMLQCLYVLASCQTGDVGQGVVERLTGALKYNWLGRGRTGRDRRGWVGMKNPPSRQRLGLVGA